MCSPKQTLVSKVPYQEKIEKYIGIFVSNDVPLQTYLGYCYESVHATKPPFQDTLLTDFPSQALTIATAKFRYKKPDK